MTWLLDGNLLIALALDTHVHHRRSVAWFASAVERFATCVVTQGTLLRLHMSLAADGSAAAAWETLRLFTAHPKHELWDDGFSYMDVSSAGLTGRRQVTDAWLAELARRRRGKVATLDAAFATLYPKLVQLAPVI